MAKEDFRVGDELWFQATERWRTSQAVEVTKVGREYGYFKMHGQDVRFNLETMMVTGGKIYFSREQCEEEGEACKAWRLFRDSLKWTPPAGWSAERIRALQAEMAGIPASDGGREHD